MDLNKIFIDLKTQFPNLKIYQNHPLAPYSTVKIGGSADIFINSQNTQQFIQVLKYISKHKLKPITLLGNASNVLISDLGIRGIIIKNDSQEITILDQNKVEISSGTLLNFTINFLAEKNLSGLEEFSYIPSTIGGAIYGNIHGADKNNFSSLLETIKIFDLEKSKIYDLKAKNLKWAYNQSEFQQNPNLIILSATLKLQTKNGQDIKKIADKIFKQKSTIQLMNSAGCIFKNPLNLKTGQIIDQKLKLKGYSIGDAQISPLHANFIINKGNATAKHYLALIKLIQSKAQKELNLNLELEIKLLGKF